MTVHELVRELLKVDQHLLVVPSQDGEGNGYSPLAGVEAVRYVAETTWSGELDDPRDHEGEEDYEWPGPNAVALWPTN